MNKNLLIALLVNICLLYLMATLLTEARPLRQILRTREKRLEKRLILGLIFGLLSISGTYTGLDFQGAVVNTRVISTVAAGLVGGSITGLTAGLIGGVHRYLFNPEGFTSLACGIGTFFFGVIGALSYRWYARARRKSVLLVVLVLISELIQALIILALAKPFEAALALERAILLPKIAISSVGLVLFMRTLSRLYQNLSLELAQQQSMALYIAQECLPFLREGLRGEGAMQKVADTVRASLPEFRVLLTDRETVLADSGRALIGEPIPPAPLAAARSGKASVLRDGEGRDALLTGSDNAAITVPLKRAEQIVGTLILIIPLGVNIDLEAEVRTAEGLARLFSTMLELGELDRQVSLRRQAEFRALQSQINPHFLYNALNTVSALCLEDPGKARELILVLSKYFRQTLSINETFVTLEQELSNVENYLTLSKARFEGAIHVQMEVPEHLRPCRMPPLILQPIVENAVRHGRTAPEERHVRLRIEQDPAGTHITIQDKGKGFDPQVLRELENPDSPNYSGLFNVRKRLRGLYGEACRFRIDSGAQGSTVSLSIPLDPPRGMSEEGEFDYAYRTH